MVQAQPTHTTHNTHTWGGVKLRRVAWDSYVQTPTFVTWEMSNNRLTTPELVLPIASKMRVTHHPRVTKKKNKGAFTSSNKQTRLLLRAQTNKQGCSYEFKKDIHICGVRLGLLPQTSLGDTYLASLSLLVLVRLLHRGDFGLYPYFYLFYHTCMFNSRRICV